MIDPELLKQLGWSEDLISEVNRVASEIDSAARKVPDEVGPRFAPVTQTSSHFFIGPESGTE